MSYLIARQHLQTVQPSAARHTGSMSALTAANRPPSSPHKGRFAVLQTSVVSSFFFRFVCFRFFGGVGGLKAVNFAAGSPLADTGHHFSFSIHGPCHCIALQPWVNQTHMGLKEKARKVRRQKRRGEKEMFGLQSVALCCDK